MVCLVIVESPAKCKKIESFLGAGYRCVASFGHIRQLSAITDELLPIFKTLSKKAKYIKRMKTELKRASDVLLATDDDREGEAIAWHLCIYLNLPIETTKRIIFHEITKTALQEAVQNPTIIDMKKVHAQQARQILDRLIGFGVSPVLWKHFYHGGPNKSGLSAGRCQTPALRLIHDNQIEINKSPGTSLYATTAIFKDWNITFTLNYHYESEGDMESFLEESLAFKHKLAVPKKPVLRSRKAPMPLTTCSLQQKASNLLHYSPKRTMSLAQKLYEGGYITYMRTDSSKYSREFIKCAGQFIRSHWNVGNDYLRRDMTLISGSSSKKKNVQGAHEAIRPTRLEVTELPDRCGAPEKRLYKLIWRTANESCMSEAKVHHLGAIVPAPQKHKYTHTAHSVVFPGWLIVSGYDSTDGEYTELAAISKKHQLTYERIHSAFTIKNLKSHYSEARLVQVLEKKGIGRPSTFSSLVDKIQSRGYVKKKDVEGKVLKCKDYRLEKGVITSLELSRCFGKEVNKLVIQPLGSMVIEFLVKHLDPLFQYAYTRQMEDKLDGISKGTDEWQTLCKSCRKQLKALIPNIPDRKDRSIAIDESHTYMVGRYGPVIKYEKEGEVSFKKVRKGIDLDKLREGEYRLDEILAPVDEFRQRRLGSYKNQDVILKKGRYGLYITCGKTNYSLKGCKKTHDKLKLEDVLDVLLAKGGNPNILVELGQNMTLRKGKYGPYIYYKTSTMSKPRFLSLKRNNWKDYTSSGLLAWVKAEYGI